MPPVRQRISFQLCRFRKVRWIRVLGVPPDHKGLHRHHTCHYSDQIELKQKIKIYELYTEVCVKKDKERNPVVTSHANLHQTSTCLSSA
jgi:hypothetical protein